MSDLRLPNNIANILRIYFAWIEYWHNLGHSQDFTNRTLESCVNVIHEDIISVWNFDDRESVSHFFISSVLFAEKTQYLLDGKFKATMTGLVRDMAPSDIS